MGYVVGVGIASSVYYATNSALLALLSTIIVAFITAPMFSND
jgi:hypothetical protein